MLINGNLFQGSEFYIVGKIAERYYTFARLNDGDPLRQTDLWISDSPSDPSQSEKTKFYTFRAEGEVQPVVESYLEGEKVSVPLFYDALNEKPVLENLVFLSDLQVPGSISALDSGFYYGVWYDVHLLNDDNVSVKLKNRLAAPLTSNPFAGFDESQIDYSKSLRITFVPVKGSMFNKGECKRLANSEPMNYFTKYVRGEIESSGCDNLTKESENCIFSDSNCNNLIGFRLANSNEKCGGRIYGPCDSGSCAYNGKKFVCIDNLQTNSTSNQTKSSGNFWLLFLVVAFFAILIVLIAMR